MSRVPDRSLPNDEHARALEARLWADQEKLLEVSRCITQLQEPAVFFQTVVTKAAELTESDRGFLLLLDHSAPRSPAQFEGLEIVASFRPTGKSTSGTPRLSRSAIDRALRTQSTTRIETCGVTGSASSSMLQLGLRAVLVEPILSSHKLLGILYLDSRLSCGFNDHHVRMLPSFAAQVAICLENIRLCEERERALREHLAEHANAMRLQVHKETLTNFLRIASHDLKGPLTALQAGISLLKHPKCPDPQPVLEDMTQALRRAKQLIADYLDFESLNAGAQLHLNKTELSLRELVDEEVHLVRNRFNTSKFRFAVSISPGKTLWADRQRLAQILANLLSNAVKYSPNGGEIVVHHADSKHHDILSISDQGVGMSQLIKKRAMQAFSRSQDALNVDGHGLGLHIVQQLVEAHGGSVDIESDLDCGTTVWLTFPKNAVV